MNSNQVETYFEAIANTENPNEWMTTLGKYSPAISLIAQALTEALQNGLIGWAQSDSCMNWYRAALEMGKDCDLETGNSRACRSHCHGLGTQGNESSRIAKCAQDVCEKIGEGIGEPTTPAIRPTIQRMGNEMRDRCYKRARKLRRMGR